MEQFTSSCDNGPSAIKTLTMPSFWEEEDIFVVECVCVCVCSFLLTKVRAYFFFDMRKTNWRFRYKVSLLGKTKQKEPPPRQITRSYMSLSSSSSSLLGHEARRLLRRLLRARLALFHGDEKALQASAIEIRSHALTNTKISQTRRKLENESKKGRRRKCS